MYNNENKLADIESAGIKITGEFQHQKELLSDEKLKKILPGIKNLYNYVVANKHDEKIWDRKETSNIMREYIFRPFKLSINKSQLVQAYRLLVASNEIKKDISFETWIRAKACRSRSGIVQFTFVLPPHENSCEKNCDYCPNQPNVTRSYRLGEPAVDRGFQLGWDAIRQFNSRAMTLFNLGHDITKMEFNIEGGTLHSYDKDFIREFVRDLYYAANVFLSTDIDQQTRPRLSLAEEITLNENSEHLVIGLTIETRPDLIYKNELIFFRELSVTRIQVGVQQISDRILNGVNRDCPTRKTIRGIRRILTNGFKLQLHWMPDLPGSSFNADMAMMVWLCGGNPAPFISDEETANLLGKQAIELLSKPNTILKGDQWKVYPTMVLPDTKIKEWFDYGKSISATSTDLTRDPKIYVPYGSQTEKIDAIMHYVLTHCPKSIRIDRMIRDFAAKDISGGTDRLGLRDTISKKIQNDNDHVHGRDHEHDHENEHKQENKYKMNIETDIRAREVKGKFINIDDTKVWIEKIEASDGMEYYISLENSNQTVLYGFVRLRINNDMFDKDICFQVLKGSAIIRELHVYGHVSPQSDKNKNKNEKGDNNSENGNGNISQHLGIGKFLMYLAEKQAIQLGYNRICVISGVGVRNYYAKMGYQLEDSYMIKYNLITMNNGVKCPANWTNKIPAIFLTNNSNSNFNFDFKFANIFQGKTIKVLLLILLMYYMF
jgi:elongator complex protein 3